MTRQAVVRSSTIVGVQAIPVDVEVDVTPGLPCFSIVGLGDAAVLEARERVRAAMRSSGFDFPNARVTVNLAPAPVRKHGTGFDLPIAIGILVATAQLPASLGEACAVGELGLDGSVRDVPGLLAHAICAASLRAPLLISATATEQTALVPEVLIAPLRSLSQLRSGVSAHIPEATAPAQRRSHVPDLSEVHGQPTAKRAIEIAAAGGLGLLMVGSPGAGKTMLARRLPGILPPLTPSERLETAVVHSVAGLDFADVQAGRRPFRAPHHTATTAGLVGGGTPPRPGEASLAHNGVLFLDELPEFSPAALQALRQPLEDGYLTLVRAEGRVRYPARFALVAAMNPCPCGFYGDPLRECRCARAAIDRYQNRVGGPLLDRIDMSVRVDRVRPGSLLSDPHEESSDVVRDRVLAARERSARRGECLPSGLALLAACGLDPQTKGVIEHAARKSHLTGRGVTRLLRVARAIADLAQSERVAEEHILEAVSYRLLQ